MSNPECFAWISVDWEDEWMNTELERKWLNCEDLSFVGLCRMKHPTENLYKLKGVAIRKYPSNLNPFTSHIRFYEQYSSRTMIHYVYRRKDSEEIGQKHETNCYEICFPITVISLGGEKQYINIHPVRTVIRNMWSRKADDPSVREFIGSVISNPTYVEQGNGEPGNGEPIFFLFHPMMILTLKEKKE